MLKVQVTSQIEIDLDEVLKGVAQLEPDELEQVVNQLIALQAQRRAASLSPAETDLLQQINQGLPLTRPLPVRRAECEVTRRNHYTC